MNWKNKKLSNALILPQKMSKRKQTGKDKKWPNNPFYKLLIQYFFVVCFNINKKDRSEKFLFDLHLQVMFQIKKS